MSSARTSVGTSVAGGAGGWESTRTTTGVSEWVGPARGPRTTNYWICVDAGTGALMMLYGFPERTVDIRLSSRAAQTVDGQH